MVLSKGVSHQLLTAVFLANYAPRGEEFARNALQIVGNKRDSLPFTDKTRMAATGMEFFQVSLTGKISMSIEEGLLNANVE